MMRKLLVTLALLAAASPALAKARFAERDEMIARADLIAVVNVTEVRKLKSTAQFSDMEVKATVEKLLKGEARGQIAFSAPNFFPCAVVSIEKGRHLVFLRETTDRGGGRKLAGFNWHFSYRPITDGGTEWYANETGLKLEAKKLEDVLAEVSRIASAGLAVSCRLSCEKPAVKLGQVPTVAVRLRNNTKEPIRLVGSLDASDRRWRYPHCYFRIRGPAGAADRPAPLRCGNINPLREKDFVEVPPGGEFDPYAHIDDYGFFSCSQLRAEAFGKPGVYKLTFVYSANCDDLAGWGRSRAAEMSILFGKVPRLTVESNELEITVEE